RAPGPARCASLPSASPRSPHRAVDRAAGPGREVSEGPATAGAVALHTENVSIAAWLAPPRSRLLGSPRVGVRRMVAARSHPGRGKSELHRALRWVTPSPGDGKESATENRPPGREARPPFR